MKKKRSKTYKIMFEFETKNLVKTQNGEFIALQKGLNRAFLFGDGIFETMVFHNGNILYADQHQSRQQEGLKALGISNEFVTPIKQIEAYIQTKIKPDKDLTLRIRWNVYRGGQGKYTPETDHPEEILTLQRFSPAISQKPKSYLCKEIKLFPTPWSRCKTLNALSYVMANRERVQRKMDEVILLDGDGYLSEAGSSNLFWQKGNTLYTPDLRHNAIKGVARSVILKYAPSLNFKVKVGSYKPEVLAKADRLFTTNVTGISYIGQLGDIVYETGESEELKSLFPFYFKPKPRP